MQHNDADSGSDFSLSDYSSAAELQDIFDPYHFALQQWHPDAFAELNNFSVDHIDSNEPSSSLNKPRETVTDPFAFAIEPHDTDLFALPSSPEEQPQPAYFSSKRSSARKRADSRRPRSSLNKLAKPQTVDHKRYSGRTREERRVEGIYYVCVEGCDKTSAYMDVMKRHIMGSPTGKWSPCSVAARYAAAHGISPNDLRRVSVHEIYDEEEAQSIDFSQELAPYTFYDPTMPKHQEGMARYMRSRLTVVVRVDCSGAMQSSSVAQYSKATTVGKRNSWTKTTTKTSGVADSNQVASPSDVDTDMDLSTQDRHVPLDNFLRQSYVYNPLYDCTMLDENAIVLL